MMSRRLIVRTSFFMHRGSLIIALVSILPFLKCFIFITLQKQPTPFSPSLQDFATLEFHV